MNEILKSLLFVAVAVSSLSVFGHGGGTDAYGCHHDRKRGGYHCHRSETVKENKVAKTESKKEIKKAKPSSKG